MTKTPIADALEKYWTDSTFWQGSLTNQSKTRFCILGLARSNSPHNPLPEELRLKLSSLERMWYITYGMNLPAINDRSGRKAVINKVRELEEKRP